MKGFFTFYGFLRFFYGFFTDFRFMKGFFTFYGFLRFFCGFLRILDLWRDSVILYILRNFTDFYGFWMYEKILYILRIFTDFLRFCTDLYGFLRILDL